MREVVSTVRENLILVISVGVLIAYIAAVAIGDYILCHPISWFESQTFVSSELAEVKARWQKTSSTDFRPTVVRGNSLDVVVRQYPLPRHDLDRLWNLFGVWKQVYSRNHGGGPC
jgi:hypothetical protein